MRDLGLFWACLRQLMLPAITLGVFSMAPIARMTRAAMLGVLSSEFIRTRGPAAWHLGRCYTPMRCATPCCRW